MGPAPPRLAKSGISEAAGGEVSSGGSGREERWKIRNDEDFYVRCAGEKKKRVAGGKPMIQLLVAGLSV